MKNYIMGIWLAGSVVLKRIFSRIVLTNKRILSPIVLSVHIWYEIVIVRIMYHTCNKKYINWNWFYIVFHVLKWFGFCHLSFQRRKGGGGRAMEWCLLYACPSIIFVNMTNQSVYQKSTKRAWKLWYGISDSILYEPYWLKSSCLLRTWLLPNGLTNMITL